MAGGHAGADVLDTPLALRDLEPEDAASRMLRTLQANILHPHVRTHLRVLALRIDHPLAARRALAQVAAHLKSAADQFDELNAYRASGEPGSAYAGMGLSASGYERLGVDPAEWPGDPAFRSGHAAAQPRRPRSAEAGSPATASRSMRSSSSGRRARS